ncbi:hypothetical protein SNEBB_005349 [Seison nebaliae]|nr:hypothetical protein SNEBB_005349 [Seison nebaliae]
MIYVTLPILISLMVCLVEGNRESNTHRSYYHSYTNIGVCQRFINNTAVLGCGGVFPKRYEGLYIPFLRLEMMDLIVSRLNSTYHKFSTIAFIPAHREIFHRLLTFANTIQLNGIVIVSSIEQIGYLMDSDYFERLEKNNYPFTISLFNNASEYFRPGTKRCSKGDSNPVECLSIDDFLLKEQVNFPVFFIEDPKIIDNISVDCFMSKGIASKEKVLFLDWFQHPKADEYLKNIKVKKRNTLCHVWLKNHHHAALPVKRTLARNEHSQNIQIFFSNTNIEELAKYYPCAISIRILYKNYTFKKDIIELDIEPNHQRLVIIVPYKIFSIFSGKYIKNDLGTIRMILSLYLLKQIPPNYAILLMYIGCDIKSFVGTQLLYRILNGEPFTSSGYSLKNIFNLANIDHIFYLDAPFFLDDYTKEENLIKFKSIKISSKKRFYQNIKEYSPIDYLFDFIRQTTDVNHKMILTTYYSQIKHSKPIFNDHFSFDLIKSRIQMARYFSQKLNLGNSTTSFTAPSFFRLPGIFIQTFLSHLQGEVKADYDDEYITEDQKFIDMPTGEDDLDDSLFLCFFFTSDCLQYHLVKEKKKKRKKSFKFFKYDSDDKWNGDYLRLKKDYYTDLKNWVQNEDDWQLRSPIQIWNDKNIVDQLINYYSCSSEIKITNYLKDEKISYNFNNTNCVQPFFIKDGKEVYSKLLYNNSFAAHENFHEIDLYDNRICCYSLTPLKLSDISYKPLGMSAMSKYEFGSSTVLDIWMMSAMDKQKLFTYMKISNPREKLVLASGLVWLLAIMLFFGAVKYLTKSRYRDKHIPM